MKTKFDANELINRDDNANTLNEFFIGIASGKYYDGTSYKL
ncbi:hypothetical protein [Psychrobacter pygoscelis]|nr:hypothetical protein [Psychrobacter pygoscelis]